MESSLVSGVGAIATSSSVSSVWIVIIVVLVVVAIFVVVMNILARRKGYAITGDTGVRCSQGHLFTTTQRRCVHPTDPEPLTACLHVTFANSLSFSGDGGVR